MNTQKIEIRYSELAEGNCCLSCGSAIEYSKAKPGEVCVDLGSGRGTDVIRLAQEVGEYGLAIGIDVSEGMLKKAEKNAAKLGVSNAEFRKSELEDIKVDSATVDLIISNCTINHAKDKFKVWSEVERILKNSGRFVVSDIYATAEVPVEYRNDPQAVAECWAGATTKEDYLNTLKKVGFVDIEIIEESKPYPKGHIQVVSFTIAGRKKCCG
ncbi:methyltransferase domain-containing protein [Carboxylicivirga caseinilyticus]|uniref:methyltransferase domain-containing protein n=1 Tax=Carboxylicivirga caseinilyticus TaxID=3417572 RepID=UPI003D33504C|nr:methyltransferase domain-containing protein [Marinilabiliaceae bacterium A049]